MAKKIAVAILGYNSRKYLEPLFDSLIEQDYKGGDYYFIDNASSDDSVKIAQTFSHYINVIENKTNNGYSGAYSEFIQESFARDYDAVVILNPDTVVHKSWLSKLVSYAFADEKIGVAQSRILLMDNEYNKLDEVNSCGGDLHYLGFGILSTAPKTPGNVTFASGTSMLIKKKAYIDCGGLDSDYFMYSEDVDLCWRMQMHGYKCAVAEQSIVWHHYIFHRKHSNRKKFYYLERNRLFCLWKNYSYKTLILIVPALVFFDCGIIAHSLVQGYFLEKISSYYGFLRNIKTLHEKHIVIQNSRIVADKKLFQLMESRIKFNELEGIFLKIANVILLSYYRIVKHFI